jgi:multidrug efflux pump subunit AcrA (membrane-fusion protein)
MNERTRASWLVYALGALCAGAIAAAILVVGPASGSQRSETRTATVAQGVVQSTVSGSGNLQAASQLNLGFKTGGTVTNIYVTQGQHVAQGQLLATLDPQSAEVTLEQAKATLQSAEANLAKEEETNGETSTGSGAGNAGTASAASVRPATASEIATAATFTPPTTPTTTSPTTTTPTATTPTTAATTPTTATPTTTTPSKRTATTPTTTTTTTTTTPNTRERESKETSSSSSSSSSSVSTATREANLASAKAAVKSDKLTVQSDEQAVQDTRLYAPEGGTIASLSGQVGENVSASGTTRASSTGSSTGASSTASPAASSSSARSSSSSSSSASSSSSTSFAVLSDLSSMVLVVPLSESEIGNVKVGQIATVTVEALEGRRVAAHVSEVAILSTSNSGVVSYDVTFRLDQMESGLKPGMSATAEVVVKQAEGINVPTTAISADTVTVVRSGKHVRQRVVTGLAGNSSTIILSGLKAGETIVLPTTTTTSTSRTSTTGRGSSSGSLGSSLGGGGGGFAGGGGAAFFRGGG